MRQQMRWVVAAIVLACVGVAFTVSACGSAGLYGGSGSGGGTTTGPVTPGGGTPLAPGYTKNADGSARAIGFLEHSDLEGGFWAVYEAQPASGTAQPKVLAVLVPGSVDETGIARLEGQYVRAQGRAGSGVSVRMAGPEILVDAIEKLSSR